MKAIYLCVIAEPWIEAIQKLEYSYCLSPAHIVVWEGEKAKFDEAGFKGVHIQTLDNAWKGLGFPQALKAAVLDESELHAISSYELTALRMMDRLDPDGESFSFHDRLNFFRGLVSYWLGVIDASDIQVVISPSISHRVFDYALYVAANLRNIKFVMFQMISFGSRSILINDIDKMPKFEGVLDNRTLSSDFVTRIDKVTQDYKTAIPKYELVNQARESQKQNKFLRLLNKLPVAYKLFTTRPNTYWVQSNKTPQNSDYDWFSFYLMNLKRKKMVKKLMQEYAQIISRTDLSEKEFVLVALHYQPEETSCPTGGVYADQILLIQLLNDVLPKDVHIVVKEHRTQFYTSSESASGRSLDFYQRALAISDRVHFVSVDDDPFELIDRALATVTISGTIGWESAIRGTPALVFGRAWYENMPRVFKVKTKSDLQSAWLKAVGLKNKDLTKEILDFHKSVEANSILATHYKAYRIYDDVTMSDSVNNLVNGLADFLNLEPAVK
jgi:hypothetical protein